jgi:hypothetical protein
VIYKVWSATAVDSHAAVTTVSAQHNSSTSTHNHVQLGIQLHASSARCRADKNQDKNIAEEMTCKTEGLPEYPRLILVNIDVQHHSGHSGRGRGEGGGVCGAYGDGQTRGFL